MKKEKRYLVPGDYMADPAVHVFNDRLYIYPSHDWESGIPENDNGDHFNMKDYHVFSTDDPMKGEIVDHGLVLTTGRQSHRQSATGGKRLHKLLLPPFLRE